MDDVMFMYDLMDLTVWIPQNGIGNVSKNHLKTFIPENARDLLLSIFNTDIGEIFSSYDICTWENVELQIFECFIARHKQMHYFNVFRQTNVEIRDKYFKKFRKIKDKNQSKESTMPKRIVRYHYTEEKKCKGQVHPAQIQDGFRTILFKVVSQELIGNNRNKKKILKALQNLLKTARTESFTLRDLVKKINVSSMNWLNVISNEKAKYVLIAKFVKWLFLYFIKVINYQFHVTCVKEERVFIFINDWNAQSSHQVKKLINKMVLQPISKTTNARTTSGNCLYIIPKRDSVRFIVANNYTKTEKDELRKAMGILRYLYEEYLKIKDNNFQKLYPNICETYKNYKSFYIVSADIRDAFGSIKQAKLYDILQQVFDYLPEKVKIQSYILRGSRRYRYPPINKIKIRNNKTTRIELVEKSHIFQTIKDYIFHTKIVINEKMYNLCKGLAQGLMLSSILCDIYYAHMTKKCFSDFMNSGFLFTYVDDSFYITVDKNVAKNYINIVQKGIPEYNCWFNKSKLQSNLEICDRNINYLGWQINTRLLEVEPKYLPVRKNTIFMKLSNDNLEAKIDNLTPLKLSKIIFSKEINSNEQIFKNIEIVTLQQACRCYTLTRSICESKHKLSIRMIRKTNFKILRKIETLTDWDREEKNQYRRKVQYIMWKSFYCVFNKHNGFKNLTKELKKITKKYKIFTAPPKHLKLKCVKIC